MHVWGLINLAEDSRCGMIGNLQYIVICRLIAHLEQSKADEVGDRQIVCRENEGFRLRPSDQK